MVEIILDSFKLVYIKINKERVIVISMYRVYEILIVSYFYYYIKASVGAAALGVSGRMWSKSRAALGKKRTAIPAILGTFTGLAFGGLLGMSQGMRKLKDGLPIDSPLLSIIKENDQLKQQKMDETLSEVMNKHNKD
ncbi:unnamed protein product [Cunninghamella blakesleeana]